MLGERRLVAPVFTLDGTVDVDLPAGRWTNFPSGEVVGGGRWQRERHGYLSLPLIMRPTWKDRPLAPDEGKEGRT